jgi:murein DD-endopeptidase MepM/ murein hydrolase activator NlpD
VTESRGAPRHFWQRRRQDRGVGPQWIRPVVAPITQLFGQLPGRPWGECGPGGHPGTDYGCPDGTPVLAASDGVVIYAGPASGFGDHAVSIFHPADNVTTTYGHMMGAYVFAGASVIAGERIGLSDSQGNVTGPHLHLELRPGRISFGAYPPNIDPDAWLRSHGAYTQGEAFMANMPTINANATLNMQAPTIRTAQALLGARGGMLGPQNSNRAVFLTVLHWFQQAAGLAVDGIIGPATWARLAETLNGH